jgi:hypothetical protein
MYQHREAVDANPLLLSLWRLSKPPTQIAISRTAA